MAAPLSGGAKNLQKRMGGRNGCFFSAPDAVSAKQYVDLQVYCTKISHPIISHPVILHLIIIATHHHCYSSSLLLIIIAINKSHISSQSQKGKKGRNTTTTRRPHTKDHQCKFHIVLGHEYNPSLTKLQNSRIGRWFIRKDVDHNFGHQYHIKYEYPMAPTRKSISEETLALMKKLFRMNHTPHTAKALYSVMEGMEDDIDSSVLQTLRNETIHGEKMRWWLAVRKTSLLHYLLSFG